MLGVLWLQMFVVCASVLLHACLLVTMSQRQQMSSKSHMSCPYIYAHNTDKSYTQKLRQCHRNSFDCLHAHAVLLLQISAPFC